MKKYLGIKNKGFTLMELLVVIAIISILTAIVLPNLNSARIKGRDARRIADIKNIQLALAVYYDTHRATGYPIDIYNGFLAPTYMPVVPKDPLGNDYAYAALGTGTSCSSYHLGAVLEGSSSALTEDADAPDLSGICEDDEGDSGADDFDGNATGCLGTSPAGTDQCYDVKP